MHPVTAYDLASIRRDELMREATNWRRATEGQARAPRSAGRGQWRGIVSPSRTRWAAAMATAAAVILFIGATASTPLT